MDWHRRLGLTMFALILFRLIWGVIGTWTARFLPMIRRLGSLPGYIRNLLAGKHRPSFGHSPIGTLSVFALLGALSIQVGTGLFTVDVDGLESGPLAILISFKTGRDVADIHELNFDVLTILIALHIAAIAFYQFVLKANLVRPMVTGRRSDVGVSSDINVRPIPLLSSLILTAICLYAVINVG